MNYYKGRDWSSTNDMWSEQSPQKTKRRFPLKEILFILLITGIFGLGYLYPRPPEPQKVPEISSISQRPVVDYLNDLRAEKGLEKLVEDPALTRAAQLKAEDIARLNYWAHVRPDGKPFEFFSRQERPGLKIYGENLAKCYLTTEATIQGWRNSPTHYENIVRREFILVGAYSIWDQDQHCTITVNEFGG